MDYSDYPLSGKVYGESKRKIGILIDGERFIVKFQKDFSLSNKLETVVKILLRIVANDA